MSERCYFCDEDGALDRHHIVPQRHGGSDEDVNLVTVCPTCHRKLEQLYDKRFYDELGVTDERIDAPSWWRKPVANYTVGYWFTWLCDRENEIRDHYGQLSKDAFIRDAQAHPKVDKKAANTAWLELRTKGLVYTVPHFNDDIDETPDNYSTNKHYLDLYGDAPVEVDEDTEILMQTLEAMKDD